MKKGCSMCVPQHCHLQQAVARAESLHNVTTNTFAISWLSPLTTTTRLLQIQRPGWQDTVGAQTRHGSGHMTHTKPQHFTRTPFRPGTTGSHILRNSWRATQWSLFLKAGNKAANALAGSTWSAVQQRFDAARKFMKKHPTEKNHLRAIFTGHWVSQARFYHTPGRAVPNCACGSQIFDRAHEWGCSTLRHTTIAVPDDGLFKAIKSPGWQKTSTCSWIYVKSELSYFTYAILGLMAFKKHQFPRWLCWRPLIRDRWWPSNKPSSSSGQWIMEMDEFVKFSTK